MAAWMLRGDLSHLLSIMVELITTNYPKGNSEFNKLLLFIYGNSRSLKVEWEGDC